jgi:hypothetical protein
LAAEIAAALQRHRTGLPLCNDLAVKECMVFEVKSIERILPIDEAQ